MNHTPKHIVDWLRMETSLKNILQFTEKFLRDTQDKKIDFEYQRILHNFIQRFHLNLTTINSSWRSFLNNSKFKYPFFLLLRSLVSDFIIMLYLLDGLKINKRQRAIDETEFKQRFIELSNSYFSKMQRELQKLVAAKKISAKRMEKFLSNEKTYYPEQFDQGKKINVKKIADLTVGEMVKRLQRTKMKKFTIIYFKYVYFSQYEHFTVKTEDLVRNKREDEFKIITETIDYLLIGLTMNIATIGLSKEYVDQVEKIHDDFKNKFSK